MLVVPVFWLGLCGLTLLGAFRAVRDFRQKKTHGLSRVTALDWLFVISVVVWGIVFASTFVNVLFVPSFKDVGHLKVGCYLTDALWFYVECRGFALSSLASFLLSLPYALWLGLVLFLWSPILAFPLWFFLLFPAWYVWSKQRYV